MIDSIQDEDCRAPEGARNDTQDNLSLRALAKQSRTISTRLLRRFTPRNDSKM